MSLQDHRFSNTSDPSPATRASRGARAWVLGGCLAVAAAVPVASQTAPFAQRDDVEGTLVRLSSFAVRPMVQVGSDLWVVNHHNSTIEKFVGTNTTPTVYDAPWDPVSIAFWQGRTSATSDDEILVVCRGSWTVVGLDYATGEVKWSIQDATMGKMAEPADILVDSVLTPSARHRCFVSCQGADSVIQIELAPSPTGAPQLVRTFSEVFVNAQGNKDTAFRLKAPVFLSLDTSFSPPRVLVAPLISGNNTIWGGSTIAGTTVRDLYTDPDVVNGQRLPDEDLFRITPWRDATNIGSVTPVAKRTGTILFAHGINPSTGKFWQLNTDANNKDPLLQGEPDVRGKFSSNRLTIVPTPFAMSATPGVPNANTAYVSLDPTAVPADKTLGQPFALAFNSFGQGFVTGLLTDNVAVFDPNGTMLLEWNLPNGTNDRAIPRGILVKNGTSSTNGDVLVYCWGQNVVREYHYDLGTLSASLTRTYALSFDPTPDLVKQGRAIFFDGSNSLDHNVSCATCHVEGGSDFLIWNLSNLPKSSGTDNVPLDDKGGMFTQTLVGLSRVAPFHWRGERRLVDFNTFAFPGLLGGTSLSVAADENQPPQDFEKFQAYLMSLTNPANPNENRTRVVDDAIDAFMPAFELDGHAVPDGHATYGQTIFRDIPIFRNTGNNPEGMRCSDCHAQPVGTTNDITREAVEQERPRRSHLKVAPFHEVWRKRQSSVDVVFVDGPDLDLLPDVVPMALLGPGLGHTGFAKDLFQFIDPITGTLTGDAEDHQNGADVTSFVHQIDQGLAPAVHFAFLLNQSTASVSTNEIRNFLQVQAGDGGCGIAVFGRAVPSGGGASVHVRWRYDPVLDRYVSDKPTQFPNRTFTQFKTAATAGTESNLFIGLPSGMSERFATDYDQDGLANQQDNEPWNPLLDLGDHTSPTVAYGGSSPVMWTTSRAGRVHFTTNEPATAVVRYWRQGSTKVFTAKSASLSKVHSVMLTELEPSTTVGTDTGFPAVAMLYQMEVVATDRYGNSSTTSIPGTFQSQPFIAAFDGDAGPPTAPTFDPLGNKNHRQILYEHVISSLSMTAAKTGAPVKVDLTYDVNFKRGGDFSGGAFVRNRAADRIVIGHLLHRPAASSVTTMIDPGSLAGNTTAIGVDHVRPGSPGNAELRVDGGATLAVPFVASRLRTTTSGSTSISFIVPGTLGIAAGDELTFVVDAVVEIFDEDQNGLYDEWDAALNSAALTGDLVLPAAHPTFGPGYAPKAFDHWSFPDTKEVNSAVTVTVH